MRVLKSLLVVILCATVAQSQGPQLAPPLFSGLKWRNVGLTALGGHIDRIVVARVAGQPDELYIAAPTGGVFKSTNGAVSWTPVFDAVDGMKSIGDLAVAPSSPNTVWVGTGESSDSPYYWGDGVYKSVDAGKTWVNMGLTETRHIGRILVHPTNPDIVLVAAQGNMWGPHAERGVFKTTDGGRNWKKVLYVDENTGANDIAWDQHNPQIVFASTYQRQRKIYGGNRVGPGSAIYRSTDGGDTWTKLTNGLPTSDMGRIGLQLSAADSKIVFADIEVFNASPAPPPRSDGDCPPIEGQGGTAQAASDQGGVYRTMDGGDSWEKINPTSDHPIGYFAQIRSDPKDRNRVYRMGLRLYVSDDMGRTYRTGANLHGDWHDLWVDPADPNHLLAANDGGLGISWDRGTTWDWRTNIPTSQFWEMDVDTRDPYWICTGTQDNGNWCTPSAVRNRNGVSNRDAFSVGGGDGMHFHIDPRDTNYAITEVNSESTTNSIQRSNLATLQHENAKPGMGRPLSCIAGAASLGERRSVAAVPSGVPRGFGTDPSYRWAWDTPVLFSAVTPGVVYSAANVLFKSSDRGGSWKPISPDLTARADRDTIYIMGKPVGKVNYSPGASMTANPLLTSLFGSITWIGESPLNGNVLYTGSDDGQVQVTRDGGATWTNVTSKIPRLPPFTMVSSVLASRFVPGRVYATFDGHFSRDNKTYVYVSNDFGQSWRAITNGLPPMTPVTRIAEHPRDEKCLPWAMRAGSISQTTAAQRGSRS